MAKKTITEYEGAEDTITKIQCGTCDTQWDNRGIRGKQGVNTVILDCRVEEKSYSSWRDRGFNRTLWGDDYYRITGEAVNDFCHDCWQTFLPDTAMMEVEEPEYYVEEKTRTEYYCDFCEENMGEDTDHEVTLNPRIKIRERIRSGHTGLGRRESRVLTREINETFSGSTTQDRLEAERDECFDCCSDCANEMFNLGRGSSSSGGSKSLLAGLKSAFFGV